MTEPLPPTQPTVDKLKQVSTLASALIKLDLKKFLFLYVFLTLPNIVIFVTSELSTKELLIYSLIDRMVQLIVFGLIIRQTLTLLKPTHSVGIHSWISFGLIGMLWWSLVSLPLTVMTQLNIQALNTPLLMIVTFGLYLSLKYFFYFGPCFMGVKSIREILYQANNITKQDRLLALKVMIAPIAFMSLAMAVAFIPDPDMRNSTTQLIINILSGIFPILSAYMSIAAYILFLPSKEWSDFHLDAYRDARLTTISLASIEPLAKILLPKQGLFIIILSFFVWTGNHVRALQSAPPSQITFAAAEITNKHVSVEITLKDDKHNNSSIFPLMFALAGEKRTVLASEPEIAVLLQNQSEPVNVLTGIPKKYQDKEIKLKLTFKPARNTADIKEIKDLFLWYRLAKITQIDLSQSQLIEDKAKPEVAK